MSLLVKAFDRYQDPLLRYVNDRLNPCDWHLGDDIAQNVWVRALESADLNDDRVDSPSGLPAWLGRAARAELREHHSPEPTADFTNWDGITQLLGHTEAWPEEWHDTLAIDGQAALLQVAVDDMAQELPVSASAAEPEFALPVAA
jgi:DNA-directed RNA polymerase specialized sigma24 family protein